MASDLISRSALLEEVKFLRVTVTGLRAGKGILHEYTKQYRDTLLRIINEQPTIEAVPVVHGEWISLEPEIGLFECSLCGHKILRAKCNYCPDCGAMMKGGAE